MYLEYLLNIRIPKTGIRITKPSIGLVRIVKEKNNMKNLEFFFDLNRSLFIKK